MVPKAKQIHIDKCKYNLTRTKLFLSNIYFNNKYNYECMYIVYI